MRKGLHVFDRALARMLFLENEKLIKQDVKLAGKRTVDLMEECPVPNPGLVGYYICS